MPTPTRSTRRLPDSSSLLLDLVRFSAALMVAFGHLTQHYFSRGWQDSTGHAVEAVGVFFVLSGFVIRYVSRVKSGKIGEYWIDRASRIYSVLLPAIGFTLVVYWIAMRINPGYYLPNWGPFSNHLLGLLALNLSFSSQLWSITANFLCNGPLWSISYECVYYAIYGCAFYLRGWKQWVSILALCGLAGPRILFLFPLWLLGCCIYEIYAWAVTPGRSGFNIPRARLHLGFVACGLLCALLWHPIGRMSYAGHMAFSQMPLWHGHAPGEVFWGMLDYYRGGLPAAFFMLWGLIVCDGIQIKTTQRWARILRILAEGTFPLYVVHFPLYVLIAAVIPYDHANPVPKIVMLLAAIAFGVLLAVPTNHLKDAMRNGLRKWFMPKDRIPAPCSAETVVVA